MSGTRRRGALAAMVLFSTLALGAPALAQPAAAAPTAAAAPAATTSMAAHRLEAGERLEQLRYRNLWIAYGLIWLVVFVFVYRTWSRGQGTDAELRRLEARLKDLEDSGSTPDA